MVNVKKLVNGTYKVYSTENKMIKNTKSGATHSEYVVKGEPNLEEYKEVI